MGCDIHIICEVKKEGKWIRNTKSVFPNSSYYSYKKWREQDIKEGKPHEEITKIPDWAKEEFQIDPDDGRNYDWFSILADVRNGYGFAGVETGEGFKVISEPRGIPDDASIETLKYLSIPVKDEEGEDGDDYWVSKDSAVKWMIKGYSTLLTIENEEYVTNPDYHSISYLSLEDFDNFDWNQVSMKTGIIPMDQYKELRGTNNCPNSWSGGIGGPGIVVISQDEADEILDITESTEVIPSSTRYYVKYYWSILYSEWFKHEIENTIEPMRKLKEEFEDVRIVFGFDN